MRGLQSLSKPLMESRGPLGKVLTMGVLGFGAGVGANVLDNVALNSRLKGMSVALPVQLTNMLRGTAGTVTPTLNATDAVTLAVGTGIGKFSMKAVFTMLGVLGLKKLAEARGWILDDPIPSNYQQNDNSAQLEAMRQQLQQAQTYHNQPSSGGLSHT